MAKAKTAKELKDEASKVMREARAKQKRLLREAEEIQNEKKLELGDMAIQLLEGKVTLDDLKSKAIANGLFEETTQENEQFTV